MARIRTEEEKRSGAAGCKAGEKKISGFGSRKKSARYMKNI